ncbi:MAG: M6 family metalloprotease domain-containing protein, partial [Longimicrobiales bacterium]|nr:M6 family metalloprotease domain-containing protein [Longimicrobiales bacterium]
MHRPFSLLALIPLFLAVPASQAEAQDVEMLGRRYGTPVPEGYERTRRADPNAFAFQRGFRGGRGLELRSFDGGSGGGPALSLGPRDEPVVGTYRIPVLLGMYSNSGSTPPFSRATIQDAYFGSGPGTITAYYTEASSGRATLQGEAMEWVQTARPDTAYTVGESGLVGGPLGGRGAGNFVYELLELQSGVDWGLYDNDGPDGAPNSGDDDGYVDVLAVIHPTRGAECGGSGSDDRIWSHRWSLAAAVGTVFTTDTPRPGGGFVRVNDYTIQPSVSCSGGGLNEIGVFTHELGHAFGLPDLYDTCDGGGSCPDDGARTSGAGVWDLMASGSWGCNNASPDSPCHMGAWTKAALGWVDVVTLAPDTDHGTVTIPPVVGSATVYRIDANDGSGEYFLLENRQRVGFDANLYREGLLVWQIDPDWILDRWASNRVNANEHQGVWLRQADGADDLGEGVGRGDAGDPFPGATGNTAFHTVSTPASLSFGGGITGVTLVDIQEAGDDLSLRVSTRFTS